MASGRWSIARKLVSLFRGPPDEEHLALRYRAVAAALKQAAGTQGSAALYEFMESESAAQRKLLLDTLRRVRTAWARGQSKGAELGDTSGWSAT